MCKNMLAECILLGLAVMLLTACNADTSDDTEASPYDTETPVYTEDSQNIPSTESEDFESEYNAHKKQMDPDIFKKYEPTEVIEKNIEAHTYQGAPASVQKYVLKTYKPLAEFEDLYGECEFTRKEFEHADTYGYFYALSAYKQYLYFLLEEGDGYRVFRYNMDDDTTEDIFSYSGDNTITLKAVNEDYLIWAEDENANWLKESINCYDIKNGTNEKIYTHPRNEAGYMNSWNFDRIILDGHYVYFDSRVGETDDKADMNLYRYDAQAKILELIDESRGAQPLLYKGISWLSFDDEAGEYMVKNIDKEVEPIYFGSKYADLYSSQNYLVGCQYEGNDAVMYYDGEESVPLIETTRNFDDVCCTDSFIAWNSWSNDYPMFYDIEKDTLVYVNNIEGDRRYLPYLSEDYLIFQANNYVPDEALGQDTVKTDKLIYYFIKTSELK